MKVKVGDQLLECVAFYGFALPVPGLNPNVPSIAIKSVAVVIKDGKFETVPIDGKEAVK